jgi:hypothetical protein
MMPDKVNQSIQQALDELLEERKRINNAIAELESCLQSLMSLDISNPRTSTIRALLGHKKPRSREGWTSDARAAAADRMRRYWAGRRGQTAPESEIRISKRSAKDWTQEVQDPATE